MVDEANANYEVSWAMLMRRDRVKVSAKVVANAIHARGYWFGDLRQKPILTPDDVKARLKFAKYHKDKPARWWLNAIHVHLDNHMFKVATIAAGRRLLARRNVRGVYRTRGKGLRSCHVTQSSKLKCNTGARGILKMGGVGGGQVLVWHTIDGRSCGDTTADAYTDIVATALANRYPNGSSTSGGQ